MAAAANNSSTFTLFSSLPLELRDQIWRDALPDTIEPALYFYKKGCWCPRHISQSDEEYDSTNNELNLNFEFRHDSLDVVHIEIPLFFVNREARNISLAWAGVHGIEIRAHDEKLSPAFMCPFNPNRDVLYIVLGKWDEFLREPVDRCFEPDLLGKLVVVKSADITRIAVPKALFRSDVASALAKILEGYFSQLKVLFIIVDMQPDLQFVDHDMKVQRRWELESLQGEEFFWNSDHGRFEIKDTENLGNRTLYRRLGEANRGLAEELAKKNIRNFKVQPVVAIRR